MTCYFRHLGKVFEKAGIVVNKENRKEIDKVIHSLVGVEYHDCPKAWKEVKRRLVEDENGFAAELRKALAGRV